MCASIEGNLSRRTICVLFYCSVQKSALALSRYGVLSQVKSARRAKADVDSRFAASVIISFSFCPRAGRRLG